jgi:hypothetical protein
MSRTYDDHAADNIPVSRRGFLGTSLMAAGFGALPRLLERRLEAAGADQKPERSSGRPGHLLDPLTAEELAQAVKILRADKQLGENYRFVSVRLAEPPKPVSSIGFLLRPDGFFARDPALDLPPPELTGHAQKHARHG